MKTILVPTDFSEASRAALQWVIAFFQDAQIPCRVLLLHTYLVPAVAPADLVRLNDEMKRRSLDGLREQIGTVAARLRGTRLTIDPVSHMGSLQNVVGHIAREQQVDLVLIGKGTTLPETLDGCATAVCVARSTRKASG